MYVPRGCACRNGLEWSAETLGGNEDGTLQSLVASLLTDAKMAITGISWNSVIEVNATTDVEYNKLFKIYVTGGVPQKCVDLVNNANWNAVLNAFFLPSNLTVNVIYQQPVNILGIGAAIELTFVALSGGVLLDNAFLPNINYSVIADLVAANANCSTTPISVLTSVTSSSVIIETTVTSTVCLSSAQNGLSAADVSTVLAAIQQLLTNNYSKQCSHFATDIFY